MDSEVEVIQHLVEIEHEADQMLREAQKKADESISQARAKADEDFRQKYSEFVERQEAEEASLKNSVLAEKNESLDAYQKELENCQTNTKKFYAFIKQTLEA